jgi:hypothetical protein
VLIAVLGSAWPAAAQEPPARVEAEVRSQRALRMIDEGDPASALSELKRAYELDPTRLTLYHMGLAYAAMGRPVEATDTWDRMLIQNGPLPPEVLIQARSKREQQAMRIAQLTVTTNVPAAIDIGGTPAGSTPLQAPLRLATGTHLVGAVAAGYVPARREVTVAGGTLQELNLELLPSEAALAQVAVRSNIPAADVFLDGARVGRTPLSAPLSVPPGDHVLEVRRRGYSNVRRPLTVAAARRSDVTIEMYQDPAVPPADTGTLAVSVTEDDAVLVVDGQPRTIYRGGGGRPAGSFTAPIEGLPWGTHVLRVERAGFQPVERNVEVLAGATSTVRVTLRPTRESYLDYVERRRTARRWALGAVGLGTVLTFGGGALALTRHLRLQDLEVQLEEERQDQTYMSGGSCDRSLLTSPDAIAECDARLRQATAAVTDRQRSRMIGLVSAGVGLVTAGIGIYFLASGEDPRRYDALAMPWVGPGEGGLSLSLRF